MNCLNGNNKNRIKYIIDKVNTQKKFNENTKYVLPSDIKNLDINFIIISSFKHAKHMEFELYNMGFEGQIINLYDFFNIHFLTFNMPFYNEDVSSDYEEIFLERKRYYSTLNKDLKIIYLERIIARYILSRDFIHAKKYIDEYVNNNYPKSKKYIDFWSEVKNLLNDMKTLLLSRGKKDIVVNWLDALSYSDISKANFLKEISCNSMFFENSYTQMPYTSMTMAIMLTNKNVIDDHLYSIKIWNSQSCELINELESKNYEVRIIGSHFYKFDDKYHSSITFDWKYADKRYASTRYQWFALNELLQIKKPCFIIIHNCWETHYPYISGCLDEYTTYDFNKWTEIFKDVKYFNPPTNQIEQSLNYIDQQLEWYSDFLSENCIRIYMSDHGNSNPYYFHSEKRSHTVMMLYGKNIKACKCKQMYTHLNFINVIKFIIDDSHCDQIFNDYVLLQAIDVYDEPSSNIIMENFNNKELKRVLQYRGIRTTEYCYVKYVNGEEFFFCLPDEETNQINSEYYKERIDSLRTLAGDYFIDIYEDDYFIAARKIYERLGINRITLKETSLG